MTGNCYLTSGVFGLDMPRFQEEPVENVEWRLYFIGKDRKYRYYPYSSAKVAIADCLYYAKQGMLTSVKRYVHYTYPEICDPRS